MSEQIQNYEFKYAIIRENGMCTGISDESNYILNPLYVPIEDETINYLLKYYYPIPTEVRSFSDFNGLFYLDAAHTQLYEEGNAALRHEDPYNN